MTNSTIGAEHHKTPIFNILYYRGLYNLYGLWDHFVNLIYFVRYMLSSHFIVAVQNVLL